jgi:hypothetical protein
LLFFCKALWLDNATFTSFHFLINSGFCLKVGFNLTIGDIKWTLVVRGNNFCKQNYKAISHNQRGYLLCSFSQSYTKTPLNTWECFLLCKSLDKRSNSCCSALSHAWILCAGWMLHINRWLLLRCGLYLFCWSLSPRT